MHTSFTSVLLLGQMRIGKPILQNWFVAVKRLVIFCLPGIFNFLQRTLLKAIKN